MSYDYQNVFTDKSNDRNINNKFFGCLTHSSEIGDSWGCGCTFSCGIYFLSFFIGLSALYDILAIPAIKNLLYFLNFFTFMIILRILSDFTTVTGIIFAYISISKSSYKKALIAYYCMVVSFIINVSFALFIIAIIIFFSDYKIPLGTLISWIADGFFFYLFVWFLFCNSVLIKKKGLDSINNNDYYF